MIATIQRTARVALESRGDVVTQIVYIVHELSVLLPHTIQSSRGLHHQVADMKRLLPMGNHFIGVYQIGDV